MSKIYQKVLNSFSFLKTVKILSAIFTKNSSRMKYLALATSGSSFSSNTAGKKIQSNIYLL